MSHPYISNPGTLIDGFENVDDWTVAGTGATAANDTSIFKQGSQSIKLNAVNGVTGKMDKNVNLDLSSGDGFSILFYVEDNTKIYNIYIYISMTTPSISKYFNRRIWYPINGWNQAVFAKSEFTNYGSDWANTVLRIRVELTPNTGEDASISFDNWRFGIVGQPKVIITLDDDHISQLSKAYPIMSANNQRGVIFSYVNTVGQSGNYMNVADLQTLKSAGWDISNHGTTHLNLITASQEDMEADIDDGYDWLVANGFGDTAKFFCYPYSLFNDAVVAKVKQRHVLSRSGSLTGSHGHFDILNFGDLQYKLFSYTVLSTTTVAAIQTEIDNTISKGGLFIFQFHRIVDSDATGNDCLTVDFQAISDYLKGKQDEGKLEVITFSDYYNALNVGLRRCNRYYDILGLSNLSR